MTTLGSSWDLAGDAEIITAVRAGDTAAFGVLYERHAPAARAVARQYSNSAADAEDAVSDAFSRVFGAIRAGGGPDVAFRAYLFTVLRRAAMQRIESVRRTRPTDDQATFEAAIGAGESTEAPAMEGFERGVVSQAYRSLPERWQAVLWYTEVEGMSPAEIAPVLGLTANGVAALAYRAREGLRQAYLQQHLAAPIDEACTIVNAKLGAYVRGGLAKRETALVESHLDDCGRCRGLVLELGDVSHGMRAFIAPMVLGAVSWAVLEGVGFGGAVGAVAAGAAAGSGAAGSGAAGSGAAGSGAAGSGAAGSGAAGAGAAGSTAAGTTAAGSAAGSAAAASTAGAAAATASTGAGLGLAATTAAGVAAVGSAAAMGVHAAEPAVAAGGSVAGAAGAPTAAAEVGSASASAGATSGAVSGATAASTATAGASAAAAGVSAAAGGGVLAALASVPAGVLAAVAAGVVVVGAVGVAGSLGVFTADPPAVTADQGGTSQENTDGTDDAGDDDGGAGGGDGGSVAEGDEPDHDGAAGDGPGVAPDGEPGAEGSDEPAPDGTDPGSDDDARTPTRPARPGATATPAPTTPGAPATPGTPTAPPVTEPDPTDPDPTDPDPTDPDPDPGVVALAVTPPADLALQAGVPSLVTVQVTNTGTLDAAAVRTELLFGEDVEWDLEALATPAAGPGARAAATGRWTCTEESDVVGACTLDGLPAGASSTLTARLVVDRAGLDGSQQVPVAIRTWAPGQTEPSAPQVLVGTLQSRPAVLALRPPAPVVLDGSVGADAVRPVELTVSNAGGTTARGVVARVTATDLPAGVSVRDADDAWVCRPEPAGLECALPALAPGAGVPLTLELVAAAPDLATGAGLIDVDVERALRVALVGSTATADVAVAVRSAPAVVAADAPDAVVLVGDVRRPVDATLVFDVRNDGATTARDVVAAVATGPLPSGVGLTVGSPWRCSATVGELLCRLDSLAPGARAPLALTATAGADLRNADRTAPVRLRTAAGDVTAALTVRSAPAEPTVTATAEPEGGVLRPGTALPVDLRVANVGGTDGTFDVVVRVPVPLQPERPLPDGWSQTAPGEVRTSVAVAAGSTADLVLPVRAPQGVDVDAVAGVEVDVVGPTTAAARVDVTVRSGPAVLDAALLAPDGVVGPGAPGSVTVAIGNSGGTTATGVPVRLTVPAPLTGTGEGWTACGTDLCATADVPAGGTTALTLDVSAEDVPPATDRTVAVTGTAAGAALSADVRVVRPALPPAEPARLDVVVPATLDLERRVPGTLPVQVANTGGRAAAAVVVDVDLPGGVTFVSGTSGPDGAACTSTPGANADVRCAVGPVAAGATAAVTLDVLTNGNAEGAEVRVRASGDGLDPVERTVPIRMLTASATLAGSSLTVSDTAAAELRWVVTAGPAVPVRDLEVRVLDLGAAWPGTQPADGWTCERQLLAVVCERPRLDAGSSTTLAVPVTVRAGIAVAWGTLTSANAPAQRDVPSLVRLTS